MFKRLQTKGKSRTQTASVRFSKKGEANNTNSNNNSNLQPPPPLEDDEDLDLDSTPPPLPDLPPLQEGEEDDLLGGEIKDLRSSKKGKNNSKKKGNKSVKTKKGKQTKQEEKVVPSPPKEETKVVAAPPPIPMDETEQILLKLHSSLIEFYMKHKPENVDEDVLTILMQFFIDAGGAALNKKLMTKYGEDLNTFVPLADEPPPPPAEYSATLERAKRQSLQAEMQITLPPPPKIETNMQKGQTGAVSPSMTKKRTKKGKKKVNNDELNAFKAAKDKEQQVLEDELDRELFGDIPAEDPSLKLALLDRPNTQELTPRDLIEAFYSKHDESKLEKDTGIEKFVMWVEQHSLEGLSEKLKQKYGESLYDMQKLARRRRNLEDHLTNFYLKHDRAKLETRWTILQILKWTMQNGVVALNRKFMTRYNLAVVPLDN